MTSRPTCWSVGLLLGLLAGGCDSKPSTGPEAAASAVKDWVKDGVKGQVSLESVSCTGDGARFGCEGQVRGGGTLKVRAVHAGGEWSIELAEPIIVASRLEGLIRSQHDELGVTVVPACGDRVRPSKQGDVFKCLIRDPEGKEVSAVEVTVTDAATSNVDVKRLTEIVDREKVEDQIQAWLGENDVTGEVRCPPPRRHFSTPDISFVCDVEGLDRKVQVQIADYRATANWGWAEDE